MESRQTGERRENPQRKKETFFSCYRDFSKKHGKKKLKWPDACDGEQNYIIMNFFLFGCRHENQMRGNGT